nr:MAG TPA: Pre-mRNA-splicing factor URN1, helical bundle, solution, mRNA [Caudoviricetes sp.]
MARYNGNTIQTTNRDKNNKTTGTGNNRGGTKAGGSINGALTGAVFGGGGTGIKGGSSGGSKGAVSAPPGYKTVQVGRLTGVAKDTSSSGGTTKSSGSSGSGGSLAGGVAGAIAGAVKDAAKNVAQGSYSGGSYGGSSGSSGGYSGSGYNNGGLSADQVRQMQEYYGTTADGLWGANSAAAAGGMSAAEAWNAYREALAQDELNGDMSWENFLDRMGGTDYEQRLRDAVNAQVQQAVNDYNRQIEQAGTSHEEAARRAYINKMLSQRNMEQELAASGVYGGMADSQRIAAEADYQNDLTDLETQYNDTMAQLRQAITAARLSGDAQIAEQMANYLSQVQSEYRSYLQERMAARQQSGGGTASYQSYGGGGVAAQEQGSAAGAGTGLSNYNAVKNNIMLYASRGMTGVADRLIQQAWGQMSAAQRNDVVATLRQSGWEI